MTIFEENPFLFLLSRLVSTVERQHNIPKALLTRRLAEQWNVTGYIMYSTKVKT